MDKDSENLVPLDEREIPPPPTDFVKIRPEPSQCGRYVGGAWDILVNSHTKKPIRAWVETKWVYKQTGLKDTQYYDLDHNEEINLGCDHWRPDLEPLQEFDRKIIRAIYL